MSNRKAYLGALLFALALTACGPGAGDTRALDAGSTPSAEDNLAALGVEDAAALKYPPLSQIRTDAAVYAPGAQVRFEGGEWMSGPLDITAPDGESLTAELSAGGGTFGLPDEALPGLYFVRYGDEQGRLGLGRFRVATEPGVWLTADRRYTRPRQPTTLTVSAYGIPDGAVGAVYLGSLTEGALGPLVPDDDGDLKPGDPIPLANLVDRPLRLLGGHEGEIRVGIQPPEGAPGAEAAPSDPTQPPPAFDGWISNALRVEPCEQLGTVRGDLGGPGVVNVVWTDGGLQSAAAYAASGSFSLHVGPGAALVQVFPLDGEQVGEPRSRLVQVGCGETVEWTRAGLPMVPDVSANPLLASPAQRVSLSLPRSSMLIPAPQAAGEEPCRTGMIIPVVSDSDGQNSRHSDLAGLALKTALNEAASRASISTVSDARALLDAIAQAQHSGDDEEDWAVEWESLQSMVASDFVISLRAARLGDRYGVSAAALPTLPEDAQVRADGRGNPGALFDPTFTVYTELGEKLRQAAICGSAEPERAEIALDEEVSIRYRVTDLGGEGADGASVSISPPQCGKLDPESGSVEGEAFETTFTYHTKAYCAERLEFEAKWSGPQGEVQTRQEETVVRITPQLPELTLRAGHAPGIGNTAALASAITLYEDYEVRNQPASLPPFTQDAACGFLEGGQELENQYFFTRSESVGKRAESTVTIQNFVVGEGEDEDVPVNAIELRMQLDTWAIEIADDNVIRGSWASGANASDPNLTRTPGTLLVFDVSNPGNLPTTPIVSWGLKPSVDDASGYGVLVFYKQIECGDDPGIGSLFSFVADGDILLEADDESPGEPFGLVTLPEFEGDRAQIVMWVTSSLTTASLRDDDSGTDIGGRGRLQLSLSVNLAQEVGSGGS